MNPLDKLHGAAVAIGHRLGRIEVLLGAIHDEVLHVRTSRNTRSSAVDRGERLHWEKTMSNAIATRQADLDLIAREHKKAQVEDWRRDVRDRLQDSDLRPGEREGLKAMLRESYRVVEGLSDTVVYDCGVWRRKAEPK